MKHALSIISFLLLLSIICLGQEYDSHEKAISELFILMEMESNLSQTIDAAIDIQLKQHPDMVVYKDVFLKFFTKYMSWEALKNDMIALYKSEYTEDEIIDIIAFYKTDTGRKVAKKMPLLFKKAGEIGQKKVQENISELQSMIEEKTVELQNK